MLEKNQCRNDCFQCTAAISTVICGSYRKHFCQLLELKQLLEANQILVLSPLGQIALNPDDEFIILDSDPIPHPKILQDSVFAKIRRSSFLTVANVNGYLGPATILEIGYAICLGIDVYTLEPVKDPNIKPYCHSINEIFPNMFPSTSTQFKELNLLLKEL